MPVTSVNRVAILPSNHRYTNERALQTAIESAFYFAEHFLEFFVLLGATPLGPEVDFGWIDLGRNSRGEQAALCHVQGFSEKPQFEKALQLLRIGSLWSTFVLAGRVRNFWGTIRAAQPQLLNASRVAPWWTGLEIEIPYPLYEPLMSVDFCRDILSGQTRRLVAKETVAGCCSLSLGTCFEVEVQNVV